MKDAWPVPPDDASRVPARFCRLSTVRALDTRERPEPVRSVKASPLKVKVSPVSTVRPPFRVTPPANKLESVDAL